MKQYSDKKTVDFEKEFETPLQYNDANYFNKGKVDVLKDGIWYEMDKIGKII
ncbi:MAG: hypothetical protein LBQ01_06420 [Prevotellaceae bacterium]|jgi:hypothetical protein|nr:hypothetical protein [Prevotellaceae bacterium]